MIDGLSLAELYLLRCCANPGGDHGAALAWLDPEQAEELLALALRTRTAPLLEQALQGARARSPSAQVLADRLCDHAREQALASLAQGRAIVQLAALLREAGFAPLLLKGVALAYRDYPQPQWRPLRDVDLLLTPEQALAAQRLLLDHPRYRQADWAGRYGIEYGHQLPEIEDLESGLVIELHHRVNARGWAAEPQFLAMIERDAQQIEVLGERLRVPSPHVNFLHLLEHAALHHAFANGPLTLADFHFLASAKQLDWVAIERDVESLGLARSLQLVAALAGALGAGWVPQGLAARSASALPLVPAAGRAMLAPPELVERHGQLRRLAARSGGKSGLAAAAARLVKPDPYQLAKHSGQSPHSAWRWLGYPAWLIEKGRRYLGGARDPGFAAISRERDLLVDWLSG